jgi:hypothetical protein
VIGVLVVVAIGMVVAVKCRQASKVTPDTTVTGGMQVSEI